MRWIALGLFSVLISLVTTVSMSEPQPAHCPPLKSVNPNWQGSFYADQANDKPYNPKEGPPDIEIDSYFDLCKREPQTVVCAGGAGHKLTFQEIKAVDLKLRAQFEYRDDWLAFGKADYWEPNTYCGDCEDYALHLSQDLNTAGQSGEYMGLVLWFVPNGGGHATLVVESADRGEIEVGVGDGYPAPINWKYGTRVAVIWMDGLRKVSAPPGWPQPYIVNGGVMPSTTRRKK